MVVEDDNAMCMLIVQLLRDMEFEEVHYFDHARDALQALIRRPVDILISDWVMPGVSGLNLLKTLRKSPDRRIARVRFLMLTGHSDEEKVRDAVDAGVDGFMAKPISPDVFYSRVESVMKKEWGGVSANAG